MAYRCPGGIDVASEHIAEDSGDTSKSIIVKPSSSKAGGMVKPSSSKVGGMGVASEHIAEVGSEEQQRNLQDPQDYIVALENKGISTKLLRGPLAKLLQDRMQQAEIKQKWLYAKMLQEWEKEDPLMVEELQPWQKRLLQEANTCFKIAQNLLRPGSRKRKVNTDECGASRSHLKGDNDKDCVDTGANQDRGVERHFRDGKRAKPNTSRLKHE